MVSSSPARIPLSSAPGHVSAAGPAIVGTSLVSMVASSPARIPLPWGCGILLMFISFGLPLALSEKERRTPPSRFVQNLHWFQSKGNPELGPCARVKCNKGDVISATVFFGIIARTTAFLLFLSQPLTWNRRSWRKQ